FINSSLHAMMYFKLQHYLMYQLKEKHYQCYIRNGMENEAIELFKEIKISGEIVFTLFF
ncbi:unnamed protein product, partial [Rotaria magnacalcarata]